MNKGKLIAWSLIIIMLLGVCQAYGAYQLRNDGNAYFYHDSLFIDSTAINTYLAGFINGTSVNGTVLDLLDLYLGGVQIDTYLASITGELTPNSIADHTATGQYSTSITVGESVTVGQLLYLKSDGKLWKADSTDNTTVPCVAIAMGTILADAAGNVLNSGYMRDDTWNWVVGKALYVSETAGALTQTKPTGTGKQIQIIGYAYTADIIFFDPNLMLLELS